MRCVIGLLFVVIGLLIAHAANAEFDPEKLSQSTVRLVIKSGGQVKSVASGFVWKDKAQVVTSLHVLDADPNAQIIVEFGKKRRKAKVKKVLPYADLVLLEVSRPIEGWAPLVGFNQEKPKYRSMVTALGFNKGALGMSTREMVKGYAKPEVLSQLLPSRAAKILAKTQMPSVDLPIYYLDGSLLPGYSGSPIVDQLGNLIGIGNGGLESGASSVSWVIPADNLTALENSSVKQLPKSAIKPSAIFTMDNLSSGSRTSFNIEFKPPSSEQTLLWSNLLSFVFPPVMAEEPSYLIDTEIPEWVYTEVHYEGFHFVKTKTRSYQHMLMSDGRPQSFQRALQLFEYLFPSYTIDYQAQMFDVYTDAHYGLNLIVPEDAKLTVENGYLVAQGPIFCRTCPYEIQYHARTLNLDSQNELAKAPDDYLNAIADQHWEELNEEGDYQEYVHFRQVEDYGSGRHVLRAAYSDFGEPFKEVFELNYFTAAHSRDAWFQVQGILNPFDDDFIRRITEQQGTDCTQARLSKAQKRVCQDILTAFNVIASTHFTSFSNRLF